MNAAKKCPTCGSMYMGRRCPNCPAEVAPESTPDLIPGQSFHGLEIVEPIGQGGMGIVYKARQSSLDRVVALKILPPGAGARLLASRFEREAKVLAALAHPNIVTIFDFGKEGSLCYFVMEYVEGTSLREPIEKRTLSTSETIRIVSQICDALEFAHGQGIVHRDIKPENILLDRRGQVKVVDFGLAKLTGDEVPVLTQSGAAVGTYRYMAPEQMENAGHVDHRADLYSTAVVLYEMLTGRLPLGKFASPSECGVGDARFDRIVMKALEKEPEKRYATAREFKAALTELATSSVASPEPRRSLRKGIWIGLFVVLLIVSAGAVWKFTPRKKPPAPAPVPPVDEPIWKTDPPMVLEFKAGRVFADHSEAVESVGFLEGSTVVSGSGDGTVRRWDLGTGKEIGKEGRVHWNGAVLSISVHPNGRWVASGGKEKRVVVWDMVTGRELVTLSGIAGEVRSVAFSPDGTLLAAGGQDGVLRLWEWKVMKSLGAHPGRPLTRVAFAPKGDLLLCGAFDGTVQVWDVRTQTLLRSWKAHEGSVTAIAVRPRSDEAATASMDGSVRFWDVRSGAGLRSWSSHAEEVRDLAFEPAGKVLASASLDSTVKLWDVEKGAELQTLRGHAQGVRSVDFARDGRRILSGGGDKTLRLWELRD